MFDEEKAKRTVDFINCLKHTKGKWRGQPFELLPWQEAIIRDVFGTVKENGYRQYNTAYVEIPKKNGKSELAAGVALYMTCGDNEWGAEVYGCASDRQQASIVFDVAVDMVEQCPALKKRIKPVMSVKRLVYKPTNSFYQVLSAEAYTKHGLNVHAVIFDELHSQPNRELFDVMTKGSGDARTQPLFFLITTAGTDRHSVCFEQHQKAEDILQGRKVDPTFYPVIYGASDDADWSSEDVWRKANPSLGHTIDIEKVRNAYLSAKDNPAEENIFRQLRLNQWVKQSTRWMQMEKWDACAFPVDEREVPGRECYGGLDLSSSIDITAFVLVFPPRNDTEKYILLPYFWIPEENMRLRVRRDHVPYDVWERQGYLQTTAVYSCVRILAEAVASLPIHVYRYTDTGKERVYDHPLYYLLHDEPNPEMTSFVFRETLMSHLLIWGNAYAQVIRDGSGRVLSLYPLLPDKMEVDRDEHGRLFYTYTRNTNENPNFSEYGRVRLQPEDVLHIPGLGFDGLVGYSPIAMAKNAVGMTLACEEYGASFFENGATPGGVLEHPGVLKDPAKVRESWHAAYGGSRNAGKVAVLEEGLKYQQIGIPPEEAQFLETRKFQIDEIARLYRIPPHMVGDLDKSSFSNIEQQSLEFVKYTLDPWVIRWEQSIQRALLLPQEKREYFVKMNVDGLLRGDYESRMKGYSIGIQNGFMCPNDVRRLESMDLIPVEEGGEYFLTNGNMCRLKDAGLFGKVPGEQEK